MKREKNGRLNAKYVHVTLHKLDNEDKDYWLEKGMCFRSNVVACLVGMEQNHEEEKGLHCHIVIQFSTKQYLSRKQFVEHFGTDSLHISTKPSKDALMMALGYVSKAGNVVQEGIFTHRGLELDMNPEIYRFNYQVKSVDDGIRYFHKVIKENLGDKNIIKKYAKREDAIGVWLQKNRVHTNTLIKLAYTWNLEAQNEKKRGFDFQEFVDNEERLMEAYRTYLKEFPVIFKKEKEKTTKSTLTLEPDFDQYEDHELEVLDTVKEILKDAIKYGSNRPHKSLNLYLWSRAPSFGKTTLLDFLDSHMMAYRLPDDQYYVDYENGLYQVLVSDEAAAFLKTKDYSHLKHILEGRRVEFNLKGREKIYKEDNPLIVLAENVPFGDIMEKYFNGRYNKEVMATRVLDLELKSRATLHFLLDRCIKVNI